MFSDTTYQNRRQKLAEGLGSGVVLFLGSTHTPRNYADNCHPYRQDSSFLYYFGLQRENLAGLIDCQSGETVLFGDDLSMDDIVWTGPQPDMRELTQRSGIFMTRPRTNLAAYLRYIQEHEGRKVHYLPVYSAEQILQLSEVLGESPAGIRKNHSVELIQAVVAQREIKSAEEIAQIEEAIDTSVAMHRAAIAMATLGLYESDIAAEVTRVALAKGDLSFQVIATVKGATLHNHNHSNMLKDGDLFLLDAGAENAMNYCGDLSSTFPVSGKFSEKQRAIYEIVLNAQDAAVACLAPGVAFRVVHHAACLAIAEGMKRLGFMKGNMEDAVEAGAHALFMPHGIGHMMGLDVHDMESLGEKYVGYDGEEKSTLFGLKSLRLAKPLKPGFVFTIEPGIYFIPELIDRWQEEGRLFEYLNYEKINEYRDFGGIRNEENYLITETGHRLLGNVKKPKTIDEIEAMMAK